MADPSKLEWYYKLVCEGYDFPGDAGDKELVCQSRRCKSQGFSPSGRKISWGRAQQPTSIFLPGESQGQRRLAVYGPLDHKESDMTEGT